MLTLIFKKGEPINEMLTMGLVHISRTLHNAVPSTWKSRLYVGLTDLFYL